MDTGIRWESFRKYRSVNGYRVLNGCPYCGGAIVWRDIISAYGIECVLQCFHCARMYRFEDGSLKLWPCREYEHSIKKDKFI